MKTARPLLVVDIEATGLDIATAVPVEVAWWNLTTGRREDFIPAHNTQWVLDNADPKALEVNGYVTRDLAHAMQDDGQAANRLYDELTGASLVGSNVAGYDMPILPKLWPHLAPPKWHYRAYDIPNMAMQELGLSWLPSLNDVAIMLDIERPNHTARDDVTAAAEAFKKLMELQSLRLDVVNSRARGDALERLVAAKASG